jgi:hypothetical protein
VSKPEKPEPKEEVAAAGKVKDLYGRVVAAAKGDNAYKPKPALPIISEEKTDKNKELPVELHWNKQVKPQIAVSAVEKQDAGLIPRNYGRDITPSVAV